MRGATVLSLGQFMRRLSGLAAVGHFAYAVAVSVEVTGVFQNLVGQFRIVGVIFEGVVVEDAQAVGNEGQAGGAEAEQHDVDDLLFVGGVGQGQAHVAIQQGGMAGTFAVVGRAVFGGSLVKDDVGDAGGQRGADDKFDVCFVAQGGNGRIRHFRNHIDLAGAQSLHQSILIFKGLEDNLINHAALSQNGL